MKFTNSITFLPYQERALNFTRHKDVSYLAIGCGGGKTFVSLKSVEQCDRVLVVAPVYLEADWKRNIARAYPDDQDKFVFLAYSKLKDNYVKEMLSKFITTENNGVIFDEAHYLKTHTAARTKMVFGSKGILIKPHFKKILFLSATPFSSGPSDMFPFLNFFSSKFNTLTYNEFLLRYCDGVEKNIRVHHNLVKIILKGGFSNIEEFKEYSRPLLFYVSAAEIEKDLPSISHEVKIISSSLIPQKYRDAEKDYYKVFNTKDLSVSPCGFADLAEVRSLISSEKIRLLLEDISEYLSENANTVIFGWHREALTMLQAHLKTPYFIHGGVDVVKRDRLIQDFNKTEKGAVMVANMQSASTGIELTSADTVIFVELSWDPLTHMEQAFKRVHRGNQTKPVKVFYFVLDNSVDIQVMEVIQSKMNFVNVFFKGSC
jgi:SWI/SNF-related matrix-associated actin-dependent regulator of chromatin subfamily A-like protein 1